MSSDSKFFLGVVLAALIVLGVIIANSNRATNSSFTEITNKARQIGQTIGPDEAPVKIIEFSDFQCPACAVASPIINNVQKANQDKVQLIFVHMPLTQIHKNAVKAALAAEASAMQGKFWEMAELLFSKQNDWKELSDPQNYFQSLAQSLSLDLDRFNQDYSSVEIEQKINESFQWGESLAIGATPTFLLNGKKIEGGKSAEDWQKLIDQELKK